MPSADLPLVELLHAAAREVSTIFQHELGDVGVDLTARQAVAILVLERHAGVTQKELAGFTGMDRSSLSEMVGRMEDEGLLHRDKDPADSRSRRLSITATAKALLPNIKKAERATVAKIGTLVGDKKPEALKSALKAIIAK